MNIPPPSSSSSRKTKERIVDKVSELPAYIRLLRSTKLKVNDTRRRIASLQMKLENEMKTYTIVKRETSLILEKVRQEVESDWKMCPICLECIGRENIELSYIEQCQHVFHSHCLDGWVKAENRTCPMCRQEQIRIKTATAKSVLYHCAISKHVKRNIKK